MSSLQNMNYEIVKTEQGKFALYVNGEFVKDYTRKSSAIRGYERLIASLGSVESGCADAQTDSACAAGCGAVQPPPTSNTGGQNFKPVKQGGVSHISEIQNQRHSQHPISVSIPRNSPTISIQISSQSESLGAKPPRLNGF